MPLTKTTRTAAYAAQAPKTASLLPSARNTAQAANRRVNRTMIPIRQKGFSTKYKLSIAPRSRAMLRIT